MIESALVLCFEILGSWINGKTCWLVLYELNKAKKHVRFLGFTIKVSSDETDQLTAEGKQSKPVLCSIPCSSS